MTSFPSVHGVKTTLSKREPVSGLRSGCPFQEMNLQNPKMRSEWPKINIAETGGGICQLRRRLVSENGLNTTSQSQSSTERDIGRE
jgi:hypothetical protein